MEVQIPISDESVAAFSAPALEGLEEVVTTYAKDLIAEAHRLEAGRNSAAGGAEVTRAMVNDARDMLRRGLYTPKRSSSLKFLRIAAAILPLAVGVMYDKNSLQNGLYMLAFVVVIALAILAATLSVLKE